MLLCLLSISLANFRVDTEGLMGNHLTIVGVRGSLAADDSHRFGLDISEIVLSEHHYTSMGIVLEQSIGDFSSSIGTIGYINKSSSAKPFGLMTELAWRIQIFKEMATHLVWRTDLIFDSPEQNMQSLGAKINF